MKKPNQYLDFAVILLLFYTSGVAIYRHVTDVNGLGISNYIGIALLIVVIILKLTIPTKFRLSVLLLLSLGLFNIVSFTYYKSTAAVGYGDNSGYIDLINPLILILIIIYVIVNRKFIRRYYTPNDKEYENHLNKMIDFYLDKFNSCSEEELNKALLIYDQYPSEAQIALKKLHDERQLKVLTFS